MLNDLQKMAKQKSLESLQGAMSDDDMQPILTIKIAAGGGAKDEPESPQEEMGEEGNEDIMPDGGDQSELMTGEGDPFMEMLKQKLKEKAGR